MANIKQLRVDNSNIYPITHEDAVMDDNGVAISDKYATKESVAATLSELREAVTKNLEFMGVEIDTDLNNNAPRGKEVCISKDSSKVKIFVIPTDEEMVIAEETLKTIKK